LLLIILLLCHYKYLSQPDVQQILATEFEIKIFPKLKEFYFTAVLSSPQAIKREPCQWLMDEWKTMHL